MVSPTEIAQQLFQGQIAQVAPTTGIAPQPQLRPEQEAIAQALQQQQQAPQRQIAPPQGVSLANELLGVSQDRLGNPIIRGLAGFLGARELQKERERAGEEKRVAREEKTAATEAAIRQQEVENIRAEETFALKEQTFALQKKTAAARIGKLEAETEKLGRPAALTPFQEQTLELKRQELETIKGGKPFTTIQKDEFFESRDQLRAGIDGIDEVLRQLTEDPSKFGAAGAVRGFAESVRGVVGSLGGAIPGLEGLAAVIRATPPTGTVKALKGLEAQIVTAVARKRQGEKGRLFATTLKLVREEINLTGAFGGGQLKDVLDVIRKDLVSGVTSLSGRAQAGGLDLQIKQVADGKDTSDEKVQKAIDAGFTKAEILSIMRRRR